MSCDLKYAKDQLMLLWHAWPPKRLCQELPVTKSHSITAEGYKGQPRAKQGSSQADQKKQDM